MKSLFLFLIVAVCFVLANTEDDQQNQHESVSENNPGEDTTISTVEPLILPVTESYATGKLEKLKPNLVALENMALVYLPKELTYSRVLEAYREVLNGIRYYVVIEALRNDNSDIICGIQVQEKPWLLTPFGDKVRVLEKSNCTSTIDDINDINDRNHLDQATLDEKFPNNTIFNPTVKHVSDDILDQIESSIVKPKKQKNVNQNSGFNNFNNRFDTTTTNSNRNFQPIAAFDIFQRNQNQNFQQNQQVQFTRQQQRPFQQNNAITSTTSAADNFDNLQQRQQPLSASSFSFNQNNAVASTTPNVNNFENNQQRHQPLAGDDKEFLDNFFNYFNIEENTGRIATQQN